MSQLSQLKSQLSQMASDIEKTAGAISSFSSKFSSSIASVQASIGGTASSEDTEMIASFQQANQEVTSAAQSLRQASEKAKNWAAKA